MNDTKPGAMTVWEEFLNVRELQEVHLARLYARDFHHGTTGHNQLMLISRLAEMLDSTENGGAQILCPPSSKEQEG